jgi:hypothetical protein
MDEETTGFWMVALGAATASGTWEGFRISPLRHTASLHVDGALTIKDDHPESRDYALVLSHPSVDRDRILVAGRGGTIEFGHDLVDSLVRERPGISPTLWLADLTTGECSERCELPRAPRGLPPAARPADPAAGAAVDAVAGAAVGADPAVDSYARAAADSVADLSSVSVSASAADLSAASAALPAAAPPEAPAVVLAAGPSTNPSVPDPSGHRRVDGHVVDASEINY